MINQGMMTSIKKDYGTPQWLIDRFGPFDFDVAASSENAKAEFYFVEEDDALTKDWVFDKGWLNPPYGSLLKWANKAKLERQKGSYGQLFMLVPARTDTKWFEVLSSIANSIYFIKGRLVFEGATGPAPFPSMVVHIMHELAWTFSDPPTYKILRQ